VPLGGAGYSGTEYGGLVRVANPSDVELRGVLTRYVANADSLSEPITVPPRGTLEVNLAEGVAGSYVSALVELAGESGSDRVVVEQLAKYPAGDSTQPCANEPSTQWFFADGFTASDSTEDLLLTNPLPDATVVNIRFVTKDGERTPSQLQGFVIQPNSLRVLNIAEQGARGETLVGVEIRAKSGALVAARAQHYLGTGRLGYSIKLGSPDSHTDWWMIAGDYRGKPSEQIEVFNPNDVDATVAVLVFGGPAVKVEPLNVVVPAHRLVIIAMDNLAGLDATTFAMSLSVIEGEGVVVEHVATRQAGENLATTVDLAMPAVMAATEWRIPVAPPSGTTESLLFFNVTALESTVTIKAVGPAGVLPIAGFESLTIAPGVPTYMSLPDGAPLGQLVVKSTNDILVMRVSPQSMGVKGREFIWGFPVR